MQSQNDAVTECRGRTLSVWSKCRCPRHRAQLAKMTKIREAGLFTRIPAEDGLAALDQMIARGYSGLAVASATGVRPDTARHWVKRRRLGHHVELGAQACWRLTHPQRPTEGHEETLIARRKLQALARLGWGCWQLGQMMQDSGATKGNSKATLLNVRSGQAQEKIASSLARAIDALYNDLEMKVAPDTRHNNHTRNLAKRNKWAAPMAWDDIEDPADRPTGRAGWRKDRNDWTRHRWSLDPVAVERCISGELRSGLLTNAERAEVIHRMRRSGVSDGDIIRHTGITKLERYPRQLSQATEAS